MRQHKSIHQWDIEAWYEGMKNHYRKKKKKKVVISREEFAAATEEFLKNGGKIDVLPSKDETEIISKHWHKSRMTNPMLYEERSAYMK